MADRILVVEDEALVQDMIRLNLEHAGYQVDGASSAEEALQILALRPVDLLVLDRMLPGMEGVELARRLRNQGNGTPILLLTARADTQSKVEGLDAGADDYLAKPFAMPELIARVRALLRRQTSARANPNSREIRLGPWYANLDTREALTNEGRVTLTEKECGLLAWFVGHEGALFDRVEILENVWGMDSFPTARTVDNYVLRLRKLFEPDPDDPRYFLTVRGRGYRFVRE
jgi:DNA-binding response OmpR family regulator